MIAMALGVCLSRNHSRVIQAALKRAEGGKWLRVPDMERASEGEGVLNYEFIITFCAGMIIGLFVDFSLSRGREGISSRRHSRMN